MPKILDTKETIKFAQTIRAQAEEPLSPLKFGKYYISHWAQKGLSSVYELTEDREHGICVDSFLKHAKLIEDKKANTSETFIFPEERDEEWYNWLH